MINLYLRKKKGKKRGDKLETSFFAGIRKLNWGSGQTRLVL